ncbi:MAG: ABC transporter permease [Lachnospiraceae bacterium]|jgi:branched-chain amino acid transport system permease protein
MGNAISILVLGISFGLVYFLLASGMTLTMGLLRVVNMSHGAIYLFAGYCGVWFYQVTGGWLWGVLFGTLVGALLGLFLEVVFLRRLYNSPPSQVLLTIGFINILQNIVQWIWGGYPAAVPSPPFVKGAVEIGSVKIPTSRFFIIVVGIILAALIWYIQDKTKLGATVRAGMDNGEIASAMGLDRKKIFLLVFVLGSMVAGFASMIGGTLTGLELSTGWSILLNSIIVVVIGGTGSIPGALIGGLLLGIVNSFGSAYFPMFASYIVYVVLIVILVVRPQGIMGRKQDIDKASDDYSNMSAVYKRKFEPYMLGESMTFGTKAKLGVFKATPFCLALIVLAVLPFITSTFTVTMLTKVLIYALFAMSLDIVMGFMGNRSLGHAAFFGMGAYCVALLNRFWQIKNFWLVLLITIVICAVLSAIIGYFTLKLKGSNFLLVTLAFCQLMNVIASKWTNVTGGTDGIVGIPRPSFGPAIDERIGKWDGTKVYFFTLIVFVICFAVMYLIVNSAYGKSLTGVRGNESRMRAVGFNTWVLRFTSVILAGIFAGIAGILYSYSYRAVTPSVLGIETAALPMLMIIMGGGGTLWGPAISAAVIIFVQTYSGSVAPDRWPLILGVLYVVCVLFLKGGFASLLRRFYDWVGTKVFKKEMNAAKEVKVNE